MESVTVISRTLSDREGPSKESCGEAIGKGDTIRRILFDNDGRPYFGYDIRITPFGGKRFRAEMLPPSNKQLTSFATFPKPVVINADEYLAIPVLERRQTSAERTTFLWDLMSAALSFFGYYEKPKSSGRITDYLQVVPKGTPWTGIPAFRNWAETPPPGTRLMLDQPHLSTLIRDLGRNREMGVSGPVVWLYREGLGRFLFSASARPGFRMAAVAEGAVLRFSDVRDGRVESYTVGLHSDAISKPGTWMIWMKSESAFRPAPGPWTASELKAGTLAIGVER